MLIIFKCNIFFNKLENIINIFDVLDSHYSSMIFICQHKNVIWVLFFEFYCFLLETRKYTIQLQ